MIGRSLSQCDKRLGHVCNVEVRRQAQPHIYVANETESGIEQAKFPIGGSPYHHRTPYRRSKGLEVISGKFTPAEQSLKRGGVDMLRPIPKDGTIVIENKSRAGMLIKRFLPFGKKLWMIDVAIVEICDVDTLSALHGGIQISRHP